MHSTPRPVWTGSQDGEILSGDTRVDVLTPRAPGAVHIVIDSALLSPENSRVVLAFICPSDKTYIVVGLNLLNPQVHRALIYLLL